MNRNQSKNSHARTTDSTWSASSLTKGASSAIKSVDTAAHNSPWAFVGGAAVAGIIAGLSLRFGRGFSKDKKAE